MAVSGALPLGIGADSLAGKWIQAQLAARLVDKEYVLLCVLVSDENGRCLTEVGASKYEQMNSENSCAAMA